MLSSSNPTKGLSTDVLPKNQEEGTYRFALNAVLETREGDITAISNELGNYICAEDFPNKTIIGHRQIDTNQVVLFLVHEVDNRPEHEIGIYYPQTCTYVTIAKGECLNFSTEHPINCIHKVRNGCETVIYFTDNYNPYRVMNITDTSETVYPSTKFIISCDKLQYTRPTQHPYVTPTLRDFGGNLEVGTYHFAIRLLDSEDNPTDWVYVSPAFPVADESISYLDDVTTTLFYEGASNNPSELGYVPRTTKSIKLVIDRLDASFPQYQLAVLKRTSTDGNISSVDILFPQPIPPTALAISTDVFIYTGQDSEIQTQSSIDDILVPNQPLYKVAAHEQLDSRLYIGNVTNKYRDYTLLQRHASSIKTEYVKQAVNDNTNYVKSGDYYFGDGSFMPDEIYAFGIVYVYNDGSFSPVMHIPGRAPNTVVGTNPRITTFTNWDTDSVFGDVNVFNPSKIKRWQVYNTATKYATPVGGSDVSGYMAYYETTTTYPEIESCDGESYWGTDWQGNDLTTSTKIRHHRFPSTELYSSLTDRHYRLGARFTVITDYPDPEIREHFYVYSDRTYERTVLDKGILAPLIPEGSSGLYYSHPAMSITAAPLNPLIPLIQDIDPNTQTYGFQSAKLLYDEKYTAPTYFRLEKVFNHTATDSFDVATVENEVYNQSIISHSFIVDYKTYQLPTSFNYIVNGSYYLPKSSEGSVPSTVYLPLETRTLENRSVSSNIEALWLDRQLDEMAAHPDPEKVFETYGFYGALKADTDIFQNLSTIRYKRIHHERLSYSGVPLISHHYNGDVFVTYNPFLDYIWVSQDEDSRIHTVFVNYISDEDTINAEFRHPDKVDYAQHGMFHWNFVHIHDPLQSYIASKFYRTGDIGTFYPESYLYNRAYSTIPSPVVYYPLAQNYEYCNECQEKFPHRIYYSETDQKESSYDPYRIIKVNNYKDSDPSEGEITDLFLNFGNLYFTTPQAPFLIPTRPQALTTNEEAIYIGTSEVLSLPFRKLTSNAFAFAGQQLFKSRTSTEYGTFYIDSITSRPILITDKVNDLSLKGLRSFWQENGYLSLDKQFIELIGSAYPIKSTSDKNGIGYTTTYDPRFKRLIISKKDFEILPAYTAKFVANQSPATDSLYFDGEDFYYINASSVSTRVDFTNTKYFRNKSFTLSYSFVHGCWVSFHSYLPNYMFNTEDNYFSVSSTSRYPYKHLSTPYQTYYGVKYDHILDMIERISALDGKLTTNLFYSSSTSALDSASNYPTHETTTFDRLVAYNNSQITGVLNLVPKTSAYLMDQSQSDALVDKVDNYYRISNIRDRSITPTQSVWSSAWSHISSSPFNFIDKIPNPLNISTTNSLYEDKRLRDTYTGLRLFFNPAEDLKISTDVVSVNTVNRNR